MLNFFFGGGGASPKYDSRPGGGLFSILVVICVTFWKLPSSESGYYLPKHQTLDKILKIFCRRKVESK